MNIGIVIGKALVLGVFAATGAGVTAGVMYLHARFSLPSPAVGGIQLETGDVPLPSPQAVAEKINIDEYPFGGRRPKWWSSQLQELGAAKDPTSKGLYELTRERAEANGLRISTDASGKVHLSPSEALKARIIELRALR